MLRFVLGLMILGLPASLLVLRLSLDRRKDSAESAWSDLPRRASITFAISYSLWWAAFGLTLLMTRPLDGVVGVLVTGPFMGMLLSALGFVLSFFPREKEKKKLLLANAMFLLLSVLSVVPPN
jgi:cytochrome c oxidase assembly factor CtaG